MAGGCDVGLGLGCRDWGFGRPGSLCFPALPNPQSRIPNPASSSERIPELLPELRVELVEVEALVLRPRVFDLERTHQIADAADGQPVAALLDRSEEHTSELQSLMRISYAVFCLKKKK